jgi:hypothetical protein
MLGITVLSASSPPPTLTFPYKLPLPYANETKTLVTCLRYHVIITKTNSVSRMSRRLEGMLGGSLEGEVSTARRSVVGVN